MPLRLTVTTPNCHPEKAQRADVRIRAKLMDRTYSVYILANSNRTFNPQVAGNYSGPTGSTKLEFYQRRSALMMPVVIVTGRKCVRGGVSSNWRTCEAVLSCPLPGKPSRPVLLDHR